MNDVRRSNVIWFCGQVALVLLLVLVYFGVRGLTVGSTDVALAHARDLVALERHLGIFVELDLQRPVIESDALSTFANWIYIWGHWPVIIATLVWLGWAHREDYRRLRDAMVVSGLLGMAIFVSYPVAPPRLAGLGFVDTVTERSHSYRVLQPPAFVNQYAAMPSLHLGWDLLVGMAIVSAATGLALKVFGYVMPTLMLISVIVTANHFILDVVAGVILVLIGHFVALRLERRRQARARDGTARGTPTGSEPAPVEREAASEGGP